MEGQVVTEGFGTSFSGAKLAYPRKKGGLGFKGSMIGMMQLLVS